MSKIPDFVDDSEKIGRFIFFSDHYSIVSNAVKYAAFLPARDHKASVYRIDNYSEEEIALLDRQFISGKRIDGRTSKARANLFAKQIRASQLDIVPEPTPHKDHANIEGYTGDKSSDKLKAMELARHALLILPV